MGRCPGRSTAAGGSGPLAGRSHLGPRYLSDLSLGCMSTGWASAGGVPNTSSRSLGEIGSLVSRASWMRSIRNQRPTS